MTNDIDLRDVIVDQATVELLAGLKSCRAIVTDYREKLTGNETAANQNDEPASDRAASSSS